MIQVDNYEHYLHNHIGEQDPGIRVKRIKKTYTRVNGKKIFVLKVGALVFCYALLLVFLCIKSATLGYQIVDLQKQVAQLNADNNIIQYQIASETALPRIQELAEKNLGMYQPDSSTGSVVDVAVQPAAAKKTTVPSANRPQQPKTGEKALTKVYQTIAALVR